MVVWTVPQILSEKQEINFYATWLQNSQDEHLDGETLRRQRPVQAIKREPR